MVWSPNYGGGCPFTGGAYAAAPGSADFAAMDTDGSGSLTMADDPYQPFYPGDAYVDWVGITLYHSPGPTERTRHRKRQVRPADARHLHRQRRYENQSALPDFYADFAVGHAKPMVLAETGALYNETPPQPRSSEHDIKAAWIDQVYGGSSRTAVPQLKMVNWFEIRKYESEAKGTVDWWATANASVRDLLRASVSGGGYVFASSSTPTPTPVTAPVTAPSAPTGLTASALTKPGPGAAHLEPSDQHRRGTGDRLRRVPEGHRACQTVPSTTTTATLTSLGRKTSYAFTVSATDSAGTGTAASVTVRTK